MSVNTEANTLSIAYRDDSDVVEYALSKFEDEVVGERGRTSRYTLSEGLENHQDMDLIVFYGCDIDRLLETRIGIDVPSEVGGFRIHKEDGATIVAAMDDTGVMYGLFDLIEQTSMKGIDEVTNRESTPHVKLRAIKFNLPWSPYRTGDYADINIDTCRDVSFWERFLDMMARNRFNVLSLWNLHPFPFLIRLKNFPEACPFSEDELEDWKEFWHELFRMAAVRGIDVYLVNWNIVVSPEFAEAYDVDEKNDTSKLVEDYTRECITQTIDEYDNLTGLGVSLCDWMNDMSPVEKETWIENTFIKGIKNATRSVKFMHRSVLAGSPEEMRRLITDSSDTVSSPVEVPVKFNWSHSYSSPNLEMTHDYHTGEVDSSFWDPEPENYRISWMIRNEDFFILRWGSPEFVRDHISQNYTEKEYVSGYFLGSEAFIPAVDYSHTLHRHKTWQYAFEKQWLFYMVWGRLLFDPDEPDKIFSAAFEERYGEAVGDQLLQGYELASQMPLTLASFHAATWDFTLYSEGFLAPYESRGLHEGDSPFISINELIDHETLDSRYMSIPTYVKARLDDEEIRSNSVTPRQLADNLEESGSEVLKIVDQLGDEYHVFSKQPGAGLETLPSTSVSKYTGAMECEVLDMKTWGCLSLYFSEKIQAGIALDMFRNGGSVEKKQEAITRLQSAASHWEDVIAITQSHYHPTPYPSDDRVPAYDNEAGNKWFSWEAYREQVHRDIQIACDSHRE